MEEWIQGKRFLSLLFLFFKNLRRLDEFRKKVQKEE